MSDICSCGRVSDRLIRYKGKGERVCRACYSRLKYHDKKKHEKCSVCGVKRQVAMRGDSGEPVCFKCLRKDIDLHEICSVCGDLDSVDTRNDFNNAAICPTCADRERRKLRNK